MRAHSALGLGLVLCTAAGQQGDEVQTRLPRLDAFEADVAVREPLAIGAERQLFVDRTVIASTDGIVLTLMPPARHPANPVLRPETLSDGQYVSPSAVLWNPDRNLYQLWYGAIHFENREEHFPANAESRDGIRWERPSLGIGEFAGSKANNL